ncbi:conserved hypothetical protein [Paraburkholderia unamae]|uniref:hypothetical protein n=1 Tax=Paraburkholderia unamae TaxID=219649 RepID=UPI001CB1BEA8|nr:hypothetical protein [Paraburkholderia unamae]CAG9275108.1 conserved hypothetical protein [Paraburkholderia unamae]
MKISAEFLSTVKDGPSEAIIEIYGEMETRAQSQEWSTDDHEFFIEAYALLSGMLQESLLPDLDLPADPVINGDIERDCSNIYGFYGHVAEQCRRLEIKARLARLQRSMTATIGAGFGYEFSQGDLDRVQHLVNELRELISASDKFEEKHQRRLLMRLEKLQAELHKRMSDLDHLWGLIGDAGVAFGKLGKDAKPIVDRVREITTITWRTQARTEELPSDAPIPQLEDHSGDTSSED